MKKVTIFIVALLLSGCVVSYTHYDQFKQKQLRQLRVATYNINWGNGRWATNHTKVTIEAIRALHADVLALQEVTPKWEKLFHRYLKSQYRYQVYRHYKNSGGSAFLSRYPIKSLKFIKPQKDFWHPAWLVQIKTLLGAIQFYNVHLVPAITKNQTFGFLGSAIIASKAIRTREMKYLYQFINPRAKTIIMGDFNDGDISGAAKFLRRQGFYDAILYLSPNVKTWRWPLGPLRLYGRFDRIYYKPPLKVEKVQVLHEGSSDHYPLVVDFVLASHK